MTTEQPIASPTAVRNWHISECVCCSQLFVVGESAALDDECFCSPACEQKLGGPMCWGCGSADVFFYPVYVRGVGMLTYCSECLNSGKTEAHL
jgi:hypothetical protein